MWEKEINKTTNIISNHKLKIELGRYNQTTEIIGIALLWIQPSRRRTSLKFFVIVLNTLWLGMLFTIKLRFWFQILPSYLWTFWSMNWWTHLITWPVDLQIQLVVVVVVVVPDTYGFRPHSIRWIQHANPQRFESALQRLCKIKRVHDNDSVLLCIHRVA